MSAPAHGPIRLHVAFQARGGPLYQAGETVHFAPDIAEYLVARGLGTRVDEEPNEEETPAMPAKNLDRPPRDTMLRQAPKQKGGKA